MARRRKADALAVETAIEKAVRSTVNHSWGKKPVCHVQVVLV
jgi:ribonuclease J